MDKQMIEEIVSVLTNASCKGYECEKCALEMDNGFASCVCAKAIYNAGYRKITENEVVLTQEEWATVHEQFAKAMYQKEVNTRKETAEKFAERMKELFADSARLCEQIDEIAKEIVEV